MLKLCKVNCEHHHVPDPISSVARRIRLAIHRIFGVACSSLLPDQHERQNPFEFDRCLRPVNCNEARRAIAQRHADQRLLQILPADRMNGPQFWFATH